MALILVVDDEPGLRTLIRTVLARAGHEVVEAPNGAIGLEQYQQRRADLVISDVLMPGMDGLAFLRDLRRIDPAVRVLIMSAGHRLHAGLLDSALKIGAAAIIEKPFALRELVDAVDALLSRKAAAG